MTRCRPVVNGVTSTALRLAPPFTVSGDELVEGVGILAGVMADGSAGEAT